MTIQELENMITECMGHCSAEQLKLDDLYNQVALQKITVDQGKDRLRKLMQAKAALESIQE